MFARAARPTTQPHGRPSHIYASHPLQAEYERSLRRELAGNDVGAATFWTAVEATPCSVCGAGPGATCRTPAGHPVTAYHSPRRKDAASRLPRG
ncbi:zinc finger domain-containing protein [Litorihabitans aurantiacus]